MGPEYVVRDCLSTKYDTMNCTRIVEEEAHGENPRDTCRYGGGGATSSFHGWWPEYGMYHVISSSIAHENKRK